MAEHLPRPHPEQHRIAKLLARAGVASRRDVERMIADGRIALHGVVVQTPATVLATLNGVTVDGEPVGEVEPTRLFLFHKPAGYLTAARDPMGRPTIYDRLPADLPRLVPVGRLDLNTEGLLLLTTDGEFKRQLELPSTGVERAYRARAYGDVTQAQLEELIDGVEIEGIRYGSIDANLERRTGANVWVEMILTEGKNREVRNVLEHLGLQVSRLIRTRYGPFLLGDLPVGGIGEVRGADLVAFRHSLKGTARKPEQTGTITATPLAVTRSLRPRDADRPHATRHEGYDPMLASANREIRAAGHAGRGSSPAAATGVGSERRRPLGDTRLPDRSHDQPTTTRRGWEGGPAAADRQAARPVRSGAPRDPAVGGRGVTTARTPTRTGQSSPDANQRRGRTGATRPDAANRTGPAARQPRPSASSGTGGPRPATTPQRPARRQGDDSAGKTASSRTTGGDDTGATPRPPRPVRKAGWARPKPKPGTRPGKPRT